MEEFHAELDSFDIHFPGQNVTSFCRKVDLEKFMTCQYPEWKEKGRVTSIPEARVPRLFLVSDQMTPSLRNRFRTLQAGECGEIQVYKSFLQTSKLEENGILIFPNVDGNNFKSKIAHVEIDLVVIHPLKGIFIVNVKNGIIVLDRIANDIKKHGNFILCLANYGINEVPIPIYSVVFSLKHNFDSDILRSQLEDNPEKCFAVQPADMKDFPNRWKSLLSSIPDITEQVSFQTLDNFATRLAALNSMEGSISLIHRKFVKDDIQRVYRKRSDVKAFTHRMVEETPTNFRTESNLNPNLAEELTEIQLNKNEQSRPKCKKGVILWTKEQLNIIVKVGTRLMKPTAKPTRIAICGPKGSGKTMLLSYLAYLAKKIYISQESWAEGDVTIADGRLGNSQILFEKLKADFHGSGISVVGGPDMLSNPSQKIGGKVIFFDEFNLELPSHKFYVNYDGNHSIVILFTSSSNLVKSLTHFEKFELTNTLRATAGLVRFAEEFRCQDSLQHHMPGTPSHNLESGNPDIKSVSIDVSKDPLQLEYAESSLKAISEFLEKSRGLDSVLITPYVHAITLERIIHGIQKKGYEYEFRNPIEFLSAYNAPSESDIPNNLISASFKNASEFPKIVFVTGNHVDGAEYGAVIVLLERSLPLWWHDYIFDSFYIAITRATVSLLVYVNNTEEAPLISCKLVFDNPSAKSDNWSNLEEASDVDIHSFRRIQSMPDKFPELLEDIMYNNRKSNGPTLVVGKLNKVNDSTPIDPPLGMFNSLRKEKYNKNEIGEKWFSRTNGSKIIVTENFRMADYLQKLYMHYGCKGISSIIIFISTQKEMQKLTESNRHDLLFAIYDYQLANCPVYLVTPYSHYSSRFNTFNICDFLNSKSLEESCDSTDVAENSRGVVETWNVLKQRGTNFFKDGRLKDALCEYKSSLKVLKQAYDLSLQDCKLKQVINNREEMAKLYTNISKMYFDLKVVSGEENLNKVETSLQFAEKSVEMNPTWDKGYFRIIQAAEVLGACFVTEKAKRVKEKLKGNLGAREINILHRNRAIKEMMEASLCWEFVKFPKNSYLVDQNGGGHFTTVMEAVANIGNRPISLLVNPGVYKESICLTNEHIDIIGNCSVKSGSDEAWITEDPSVVLQDIEDMNVIPKLMNSIFLLQTHLSLTRVSVYNWKLHGAHVLYATGSSDVEIMQCAFYSKCAAAIGVDSHTKLVLTESRSVNSYGAVLAANDCSINVKKCLIQGTTVAGVELRDGVSASVDHCTFIDCEGQGLSAIKKCEINLKNCVFINNAKKKGLSEGSIQLLETKAVISNSKIMNQNGCGIVIEYGSGKFVNLVIDRCKTGILTQAPIHVTKCAIKMCLIAVGICDNIEGEIVLEDNLISKCRVYYNRDAKLSPLPMVINNIGVQLPMPIDSRQVLPCNYELEIGRLFHEKVLANHRAMQTIEIYEPINEVLGLCSEKRTAEGLIDFVTCNSCTQPRTVGQCNFFLCSLCEVVFYCSQKCYEEDKELHKAHCLYHVKATKMYRKSISWKEEHVNRIEDTCGESYSCSTNAITEISTVSEAGSSQPFRKKKKKKKKSKF